MTDITARVRREDVTVTFPAIELTGTLDFDPITQVLVLLTDEGPEHLSTSMHGYGYAPAPGFTTIKDWSEHEGLAPDLARQGLVEIVDEFHVGPFASRVFLVKVAL